MKKGTVVISGILALGLLGAGAIGMADARPVDHAAMGIEHRYDGHRHHYPLRSMMRKLDLSEAQRGRIREIFREQAPAAREKAQALRETGKELRDHALSEGFDPARAQALSERQAELMAELHLLRVTGLNEAYQVLDAEQKEKLAAWQEKRHERAGKDKRAEHGRHHGMGKLHH